jgi:hypothetical protein
MLNRPDPRAVARQAIAAFCQANHRPAVLIDALRAISDEHSRWQGFDLRPQEGSDFAVLPMDQADVLVEYDFHDGEASSDDHPGCPAAAQVLNVLINGRWVDAGCVARDLVDQWETTIMAAHTAAPAAPEPTPRLELVR